MSLEIALSGLKRYRLRTALSLFGLAIGVGALLVTVAIGGLAFLLLVMGRVGPVPLLIGGGLAGFVAQALRA